MDTKLKKFTVIFSVVGLSFFTWPMADDIAYKNMLNNLGVFGENARNVQILGWP